MEKGSLELGLGFEITELRLGLPGGGGIDKNEKKRSFSRLMETRNDEKIQAIKTQVVGWPPVCSYRKKNNLSESDNNKVKMYVKVSMDGAPFLRKVDLSLHEGYNDLDFALEKLFGCFGIGKSMEDGDEGCDYVPIYEDNDGDWMLVGDFPWEMFREACKRMRIMKKSEAKVYGLHIKGSLKSGGY